MLEQEDASGAYYVDETCISCAACWKEAPTCFASHPIHTYAYVINQPETETEVDQCAAAMKICPVQAIHRRSE